jgi:hypothetical protein
MLLRFYGVFVATTMFLAVWGGWYLFSPIYGPLAGFALGVVVVLWRNWARGLRRPRGTDAILRQPRVELELADAGLTIRTALSTCVFLWPAIGAVYRVKHYRLLVRLGQQQYLPVPTECLSDDAWAFLEAMVRSTGGRVR